MGFKVVGLGEVLWDLLDSGPQLGGAPANFAYHARALGADAWVITRVGNDDYGREVIRRFCDMGVPTETVQVDERAPTGTAKVELSANGLAHFTITEDVAWDRLRLNEEALACVASADAICFGSLAQRNESARQTIEALLTATPATALRVFDINLRQQFYSAAILEQSLRSANCHEAKFELARQLLDFVLSPNPKVKIFWRAPAPAPINVWDTVGAGDSFTAALVMGLLSKMDLNEINSAANEIARYVCSHAGATPDMPTEFARKFLAPT